MDIYSEGFKVILPQDFSQAKSTLSQTSSFGHQDTETGQLISNYWMRLCWMWGVMQVEEDVNHQGWRPRWITSYEISIILQMIQKPNSIINVLLFIQKKIFCKFLTSLPPRRLSSKLWPIFRYSFGILTQVLSFLKYTIDQPCFQSNRASNRWFVARIFWIWSVPVSYEELAMGLEPIRNGEIFWMNNNQRYPCLKSY